MKILITGGAGFIGSNIALELQRRFPQSSITVVDDFSSGNIANLQGFTGEIIRGRVDDRDFIGSLPQYDVIFHEAAITDTTIEDENSMFRVNVKGFQNILEIVGSAIVVYASSAGVYGKGPVPMKETQPLQPLNAYALSKAKMDEIAMSFAKREGKKIIGIRYFNVYGPGEKYKGKAASMIWQLSQQMKQGKRPRIFKYGEQQRDFIYIKDVIEATIKAVECPKSCIINIGTGIATTFNYIIEVLNKVLGTSLEPDYFDNPYGFYQNYTLADVTLAKELIGFTAKYSIYEGIKDYLMHMES